MSAGDLDALDEKRIAEVLAETPITKDDIGPVAMHLSGLPPFRQKLDRIRRDLERAGFRIVRSSP